MDHNNFWESLKQMWIPDHLICLLRNMDAGHEAIVRTRHGTTDWFKIGKGVWQSCILSLCLFNFLCAHTHAHTCIHTRAYTLECAHMHWHTTYTLVCAHTSTHLCVNAHAHTLTCAPTHAFIHMHIHVCVHAHTSTPVIWAPQPHPQWVSGVSAVEAHCTAGAVRGPRGHTAAPKFLNR